MCSIVGSYDANVLKDLIELNARRGQFAHSITFLKLHNSLIGPPEPPADLLQQIVTIKNLGPPDLNKIDEGFEEYKDWYCIVHQQAPTTKNKGLDYIHPVIAEKNCLWHNGIIKEEAIKKLQEKWQTNVSWDSELLLYSLLQKNRTNVISKIDGTFACIWRDHEGLVYILRNSLAPLFIDDSINISSMKFNNISPSSRSLLSERIFRLNATGIYQAYHLATDNEPNLSKMASVFKTFDNPYDFTSSGPVETSYDDLMSSGSVESTTKLDTMEFRPSALKIDYGDDINLIKDELFKTLRMELDTYNLTAKPVLASDSIYSMPVFTSSDSDDTKEE